MTLHFFQRTTRKVLAEMEADGALQYLTPPPGRRRGTYADKMAVIEFL